MNRQAILFGLLIILSSCGQSPKDNIIKTDKGFQEFYDNGFIKTELIKKADSLEDKYFYNLYDSGLLDSLYQFKLYYDTMVAWRQYIYNTDRIKEELTFESITLDSGDYIKFRLIKPHYDIISLYLRKNNKDKTQDTTLWGQLSSTTPRQFYLADKGDSVLTGFVIDWGVWSKSDTVGTYGIQINRYLKFSRD
jgi:hypothetical protein